MSMEITSLIVLVSKPTVSLFLVALSVSLTIVLSYKIFVDLESLNEAKKKLKKLQERLIEVQREKNVKEANRIIDEMTKINKVFIKESIKPMIVSLILLVTVFPVLSKVYTGKVVAKLPFSLPFVGSQLSWIGWYIIVSLTITWILKRLLGVET